MKLPSRLAKSRHGVFYFRLTFLEGDKIKEKRISLRTKCPQEAQYKSTCLSVIMLTQKRKLKKNRENSNLKPEDFLAEEIPQEDALWDLLVRFDRQQLSELSGIPLGRVNALFEAPVEPSVRKLDIEVPGGISLRNINSDEDMNRAVHRPLPVARHQ